MIPLGFARHYYLLLRSVTSRGTLRSVTSRGKLRNMLHNTRAAGALATVALAMWSIIDYTCRYN